MTTIRGIHVISKLKALAVGANVKQLVGILLSMLITISPMLMIAFVPTINQTSLSSTEKENDITRETTGGAFLEDFTPDDNDGSSNAGGSSDDAQQPSEDQGKYKIAFVKPVYTATAYSSYYTFFSRKTSPERYLRASLVNSWSHSSGAVTLVNKMLKNDNDAYNSTVITDADVHAGKIFHENGSNAYDVLIFLHSEYVTLEEYYNTMLFVKQGGNVIILNANSFFAEIDHDLNTSMTNLIIGKGWSFDGENAARYFSYARYWGTLENMDHFKFIGSRYSTFKAGTIYGGNVSISADDPNPHPIKVHYSRLDRTLIATTAKSREENTVITPNVHPIVKWETSYTQKDRGVMTYEYPPFGPRGGSVIHLGIFGSDFISKDDDLQDLFLLLLKHLTEGLNIPWIRFPVNGGVYKSADVQAVEIRGGNAIRVEVDGTFIPLENSVGPIPLGNLSEGVHHVKVTFDDAVSREVTFSIDDTRPSIQYSHQWTNNGTELTLIMKVNDQHPENAFIYVFDGKGPNFRSSRRPHEQRGLTYRSYFIMSPLLNANNSITITIPVSQPNQSFLVRVDLIDSAGWTKREWIAIGNQSNDVFPAFDVLPRLSMEQNAITFNFSQLNASEFRVFLEVSFDQGKTWNRSLLNNTDSEVIVITVAENQKLWYRVGFRREGKMDELYYISVRTTSLYLLKILEQIT